MYVETEKVIKLIGPWGNESRLPKTFGKVYLMRVNRILNWGI